MNRAFLALTISLVLFEILHPMGVKAGQKCNDSLLATSADAKFLLNPDGTVTDNTTGLMWMRCALGQDWKDGTCSGKATSFSWVEALKVAQLHNFAQYQDWRLPNKNQLESIVESRCVVPSINEAVFPETPATFFWSSSPYAGLGTGAWSVDFGYGVVTPTEKTGKIHVRLVREDE